MIFRSDMFINDDKLRKELVRIMLTKTRNQIVNEIKANGNKFHQYNIDRFVQGKPVSIETLKKLDNYVNKNQ
jgi:uncharacterized protein involved in tolerance to divalent cations